MKATWIVILVLGGIIVAQNWKRLSTFGQGLGSGGLKGLISGSKQQAFPATVGPPYGHAWGYHRRFPDGTGVNTMGPGGSARSTIPGVLNVNSFKGRYLNRYGR